MSIGARIQASRKLKKWTQKRLASELRVATGTIQQYELGKRTPSLEMIIKIADKLGIAPAILLSDEYFDKSAMNNKYIQDILSGKAKTAPDGRTLHDLLREDKEDQYRVAVDIYGETIKQHLASLNETGMQTAVKRVEELTEIPKYQKSPSSEDEKQE